MIRQESRKMNSHSEYVKTWLFEHSRQQIRRFHKILENAILKSCVTFASGRGSLYRYSFEPVSFLLPLKYEFRQEGWPPNLMKKTCQCRRCQREENPAFTCVSQREATFSLCGLYITGGGFGCLMLPRKNSKRI